MVIYPLPTTTSCLSFVGYVVQGSNGEYVFLREEERVELVKRAAEMASPDKIIVAGAGCECKYSHVQHLQVALLFPDNLFPSKNSLRN